MRLHSHKGTGTFSVIRIASQTRTTPGRRSPSTSPRCDFLGHTEVSACASCPPEVTCITTIRSKPPLRLQIYLYDVIGESGCAMVSFTSCSALREFSLRPGPHGGHFLWLGHLGHSAGYGGMSAFVCGREAGACNACNVRGRSEVR